VIGKAHLFVYGTLMTSADGVRLGTRERRRLQREGRSLGAATMPGRLYDLGAYPALAASSAPDDIVHGEVLQLTNAASVFAWLDRYENAVPGAERKDYERVQRIARLAPGADIEVWVYVYLGLVSEARRIAGGHWQPQ
jgi:gamma-glutamylcyclotransferase (GGCT)/AIG2-like uncharacterized protein YtfP